jgi:hypothetical protein
MAYLRAGTPVEAVVITFKVYWDDSLKEWQIVFALALMFP